MCTGHTSRGGIGNTCSYLLTRLRVWGSLSSPREGHIIWGWVGREEKGCMGRGKGRDRSANCKNNGHKARSSVLYTTYMIIITTSRNPLKSNDFQCDIIIILISCYVFIFSKLTNCRNDNIGYLKM